MNGFTTTAGRLDAGVEFEIIEGGNDTTFQVVNGCQEWIDDVGWLEFDVGACV